MANNSSNEKLIRLLEVQLAHANQQNQELLKQVESLLQQIHRPSKIDFLDQYLQWSKLIKVECVK